MFLNSVIFHFYVGGWVSDSHVQAQILPVGACKGDEQVGRTLFFNKCQTTGVGGQVVTKIAYQLFFSVFRDIFI